MIHLYPLIYSEPAESIASLESAKAAAPFFYYHSSMGACNPEIPAKKGQVKAFFRSMKEGIRNIFYYAADGIQIFFYVIKNKILCIRTPNFHRVGHWFYRGGQPTKKGFSLLEKRGIRTIISLRGEKSDEPLLEGKMLNYAHFAFSSKFPSTREVVDFLRIIKNPDMQPVFVHCYFGADRTGIACALYRIFIENWPKDKAIKEMRKGGFGFHYCYRHFVDFIQGLNIQKIKEQLYSFS